MFLMESRGFGSLLLKKVKLEVTMVECAKDGCNLAPMSGEKWCFFHHPNLAAERHEASSKGGKAGRKVLKRESIEGLNLDELGDLNRLLARLVSAVVCGEISSTVAKSAGYLVRSIAQVRETALLEARIAMIEQKINEMGGLR